MGRKKVSDMTPEELEAHRAYMREKKRESRAGKPPEKQAPYSADRREYYREYRRKQRANNKES